MAKGDFTPAESFGTPDDSTTYSLCIYDSVGGADVVSSATRLEHDNRRWRPRRTGYVYRGNNSYLIKGVKKITLRSGDKPLVKLILYGGNAQMPAILDPSAQFSLEPRVTVQLVNDTGACWTSEFEAADVKKHTPTDFKAKK